MWTPTSRAGEEEIPCTRGASSFRTEGQSPHNVTVFLQVGGPTCQSSIFTLRKVLIQERTRQTLGMIQLLPWVSMFVWETGHCLLGRELRNKSANHRPSPRFARCSHVLHIFICQVVTSMLTLFQRTHHQPLQMVCFLKQHTLSWNGCLR